MPSKVVAVHRCLSFRPLGNLGGDTAAKFTPDANLTLGTWDSRIGANFARLLATEPPAAAIDPSRGS